LPLPDMLPFLAALAIFLRSLYDLTLFVLTNSRAAR
jgi:hypothetical protein